MLTVLILMWIPDALLCSIYDSSQKGHQVNNCVGNYNAELFSFMLSTNLNSVRAGSQNDASLALRQLRCDKILKTDWSNATQLMQR